jgi:lipopolysaccharide export system protein LptA
LVGVAGFIAAYILYAQVLGLGNIDGLPPLPRDIVPVTVYDGPPPPRPESMAEKRLRQAFGEECPELKRAIKLEVRSRGIVLAADQFNIEKDGRVKLQPFSCAIFGKPKGANQTPEINTVRSEVAFLTFDRPITSPQDMNGRKIIGGELRQDDERPPEDGQPAPERDVGLDRERRGHGGVLIVNNHRTPERDDDMSLFTPGPVYYSESLQRIWTANAVRITDLSSQPQPTLITGTGMDVYLSTDTAPPGPGKPAPANGSPAKPKTNSTAITGVERVVLRADVEMHLYIDSQAGFVGNSRRGAEVRRPGPVGPVAGSPSLRLVTSPVAAVTEQGSMAGRGSAQKETTSKAVRGAGKGAAAAPEEKDLVVIKTQGPFEYLVETDRARFDISQHPGPHPNRLEVCRQHGTNPLGNGLRDVLDCEHLEIQFRRKSAAQKAEMKPATPPPAADDRTADLEIESAHAWGELVLLTSEAEKLHAFGNDMVYNALKHESVLKGDPEMVAVKDSSKIYARDLTLLAIGDKDDQQAVATGPGRIEMQDAASGRPPMHATWKDKLVSSRDGPYDVVTFTGGATFEDKERGQLLQADTLKLWLEPAEEKKDAAPASATSSDSRSRKPHHLDARGNVVARAPEMNIQDTERLVVWFKDAAPGQPQLPATLPSTPEPNAPQTPMGTTDANAPPARSSVLPGQSDDPQSKPKRPIDLSARFVEAHVVRGESKNDLEKIWCEGMVRVRQEPAAPEDKGVDIRGQTLQVTHFLEGDVMLVTGDMAEVHLDKLSILGPEVNIDQKQNQVWVNGIGAMRMPSKTTFRGEKLEREVDMTVHWNRNMFFNGRDAEFYGGVQGEQENARLACQTMHVFLDRMVSLKEGDKGKQQAKVDRLVCDKNVRIEDSERENGKLLKYQRLDSKELDSDQQNNEAKAAGPGVVRIIQLGDKDDGVPGGSRAKPAANNAPKEEVLKLTRVTFLGRMWTNNATRTAIFSDNVEVVNVPSDNPDLPIDIDHLPEGGLYLRCERLKVYSQKDAATGKASQQMEACRKAQVQAKEFWGRAETIKYDESKEQVIFEAGPEPGSMATLYRVTQPGAQPDVITGKKITYWRRTNDFKVDQMNMMRSIN